MSAQASTRGGGAVYAAIWRWHFIAGLIVLPVLTLMAVTGGLYLFKPEIDHLVYRRFEDVPARAQPYLSADRLIGEVQAATGGRVLQFTPADRPDRAVRLLVRAADGRALTAFADPYDGRLIGTTAYGGVMQLIRKIHSLQKFGFWASMLVETAAGWAIVMVLTGVYLWWPRRGAPASARGGSARDGGVTTVRPGPPGRVFWRVFWRDLHAVTGAYTGAVILFLAVTGMPWSLVWGDHVQRWVTAANLYEPEAPAKVTPSWMLTMDMPVRPAAHMADQRGAHSRSQPMSGPMSEAKPDLPWALEKAPQPASAPADGRAVISVDAAVAALDRLGLQHPYSLALPDGPDGAYVGDYRPDRVEDSRTLYLDQYSGRTLKDVGFKDWGPAAKAIEWGIAVHQGEEYGPANRYVMLAGCLAIVLLSVSAVVMWWKRRPAGRLAVPPAPADRRGYLGLAAIVAPLAILYPLVGASILIGLALDLLLRRRFSLRLKHDWFRRRRLNQ